MSQAYNVMLDTATLAQHLDDPTWAFVDCRFALADPMAGRRAYVEAHIPGAVYAHLDQDLSAPVRAGDTGRHPLPSPDAMAETLGGWGIDGSVQVVAYDDLGGAIAARLWWQLHQLGHDRAAVLDGGWSRWMAEGRPTRSGVEARPARHFHAAPRPAWVVDAGEVRAALRAGDVVLDARGEDRYRGEQEPIDDVAGHIPGARSAPFASNLEAAGGLRASDALRARFQRLLQGADPERAIVYCGSGVTAAHDILAMAHAGMPLPRLYAGSWSHWITDPERPIATGPEPGGPS